MPIEAESREGIITQAMIVLEGTTEHFVTVDEWQIESSEVSAAAKKTVATCNPSQTSYLRLTK